MALGVSPYAGHAKGPPWSVTLSMPKQSAASRARLGADSAGSNGTETANTEGEPTTSLTRQLFRDSADLVWMHVHLPFTRGLAHGTLAK